MSKVGTWSTNAGNNNATPPDGWPEGQAPSTVNDCAREMMAQIRTMVSTPDWIDLGSSPSFLTATTFSLGAANTTDFVVGRRVKLFDAATLYGTINSVSGTFVSVQLDSGALTVSLSSVALGSVSPAQNSMPNSVMRRRNVIINGQFDIWQRGSSFGAVGTGLTYGADRFYMQMNTGGTLDVFRNELSATSNAVPTLAQTGVYLTNSLTVRVNATDASVASGEFVAIQQRVEGSVWRQIAHKPMCLSFWASTNRTGTYCISITNNNSSASFVQNYTLGAVNTWTHFSIPILAAPTAPYTWDYSGGVGLVVSWGLMAGSNFQVNAGDWTAQAAIGTSSQLNFMASAGNQFSLAAVQLEEGLVSTQLEPTTFLVEYDIAKRYYESDTATRYFYSVAANHEDRVSVQFSVQKRAAPTMTLVAGAEQNITTLGAVNPTTGKFDMQIVATGGGQTYEDGALWKADAEL